MRYTGEVCPYCGVEFTEQDDIVVCPDCGTPHHRVCWFAHGECAAADKHADGYAWHKSAEPEPQPEEEKAEENTQARNQTNLDIICPDCGETCANGTLRCPNCGAVLIPFANPMGEPPMAQFKPGFNSEEDIRGLKAGDIALFCRTAGASYIKKFRKNSSWNWAAFFFAPYWFFYRKLYKAGAIFFAALISLNLLLIPVDYALATKYEPIMTELALQMYDEEGTLKENWQELYVDFVEQNPEIGKAYKPFLLEIAIYFSMLVLNIIAAIIANKLYFKKACTDIKDIRSKSTDERVVQLELFRRGGTNILWGSGSYFASKILIDVAAYFMIR